LNVLPLNSEVKDILEAFGLIQENRTPLQANCIICSVCGCSIRLEKVALRLNPPCEHLRAWADSITNEEERLLHGTF
jgi:hypothetical protein